MSTADPPPATKTPRRRSKAKKSGASVSDLILKAVSSSKERGGVSLVALKKALTAAGYDVVRNNSRIKLAVKRLVANRRLIQTKGTGASGSFKIGSKAAKPKKPKAKKPKRAKKKSPKKPAGAKKSPKKRRRTVKSAEKASETPAIKKSPKPKRAKRRVSKKGKTRAAKK